MFNRTQVIDKTYVLVNGQSSTSLLFLLSKTLWYVRDCRSLSYLSVCLQRPSSGRRDGVSREEGAVGGKLGGGGRTGRQQGLTVSSGFYQRPLCLHEQSVCVT